MLTSDSGTRARGISGFNLETGFAAFEEGIEETDHAEHW